MEEHIKDNFVDEEIDKSIQKIKKLFSYGMQQSSCVFVPDEKVCSVSFQTSFEPFYVNEKAKEAAETFHKILEEIMEQGQLPQYLYKILNEQKHETSLILEQYDSIISELSKSLVEYDKEYRQKCEKHSLQHQLLEENIEDLISEINRIGKEEIQNIRTSIIQNTKTKSDKCWEQCQNLLDDTAADIPFDDYIWNPPTSMLPFEELVDAFSVNQDEVITKRRDMLSKICKLRKNLEKEKLDHALKLEKLEKELFEVKENYKRKKLAFAKLKRKQTKFIARRDELYKELNEVQQLIEKECEAQKKIFEKHYENKKVKSETGEGTGFKAHERRYGRTGYTMTKYLIQENNLKYNCVFKERCMEASNILLDIMAAMKFVMEKVLEVDDYPINFDGLQMNQKNILSYFYGKAYWQDFLSVAPNVSIIDDVMKALEDHWFHLKIYFSLLNEKRTLCLENQELQTFLKNYHSFEK